MNREKLFDALADVDEAYIAEALRYSPEASSGSSERIVHLNKKRMISFALAAALILALGIAAYAVFSTYSTRVPEPEETFRINWEENASGYIEWTDAKLAVTFPDTAESKQIEFRPGWLPEPQEGYSYERYHDEDEEDWFWYDTCFFDRHRGGAGVEYQIECHYAWPGYTVYMDGLEAHVVKEEDWDTLHITEIEQQTNFKDPDGNPVTQRMLLLFDSAEGWFLSIGGRADFETLEHIAREMEVRSLDELAEPPEGSNFYFLGVGVG